MLREPKANGTTFWKNLLDSAFVWTKKKTQNLELKGYFPDFRAQLKNAHPGVHQKGQCLDPMLLLTYMLLTPSERKEKSDNILTHMQTEFDEFLDLF